MNDKIHLLPEFIASGNLDLPKPILGRVRADTWEHLQEVREMLSTEEEPVTMRDAVRYAIECGIAALAQAGAL